VELEPVKVGNLPAAEGNNLLAYKPPCIQCSIKDKLKAASNQAVTQRLIYKLAGFEMTG
jgi:hypothetical protein